MSIMARRRAGGEPVAGWVDLDSFINLNGFTTSGNSLTLTGTDLWATSKADGNIKTSSRPFGLKYNINNATQVVCGISEITDVNTTSYTTMIPGIQRTVSDELRFRYLGPSYFDDTFTDNDEIIIYIDESNLASLYKNSVFLFSKSSISGTLFPDFTNNAGTGTITSIQVYDNGDLQTIV